MQVFYGVENKFNIEKVVLTIGTFDGVHLGHQQILKELVKEAKKIDGKSVLITFEPHPRLVLSNFESTIELIDSLDEKIEKLKKLHLDYLFVIPFTKTFANQQPQNYVENFLIKNFNLHTIIIGYDHRFGNNRAGDIDFLKTYRDKNQFQLIEISAKQIDENTISSSKIRLALKNGEIELANKYLGNDFVISGTVMHGAKRGRTIGYPTANLKLENDYKIIPQKGVFIVKINIEQENYFGVCNVGINPTTEKNNSIKIETFIFDFEKDIYEKELKLTFLKYIRPEKKFKSLEELKIAIAEDVEIAKNNLHYYR
jgi:riboflavin kinase/FMN adenylyltransferase